MLITFEGLDCSGKTTQANLLVDKLKQAGKKVLFLREPGGTPISEKIRELLLDQHHHEMSQRAELFLFSAARTQLVAEVILPALKQDTMVVLDRYYDSTTVYQGYGRGLDLQSIRSINSIATFGTTPDLTFLIDIDVEEIYRRRLAAGMDADRMEASGKQFYEKVRQGYRLIAAEERLRFVIIDGIKPIETIHQKIWKSLQIKMK